MCGGHTRASLVAQLIKKPPAMWEAWIQSLGWQYPLEKGKAAHSSILAWRIPWTVHGVAKSRLRLSNFHFHYQVGEHFFPACCLLQLFKVWRRAKVRNSLLPPPRGPLQTISLRLTLALLSVGRICSKMVSCLNFPSGSVVKNLPANAETQEI